MPLDAERVELRLAARRSSTRVLARTRPLHPFDFAHLLARQTEPGLLIVPAASSAVRAMLDAAGWSWLVDDGRRVTGVLRIAGHRLDIGVSGNDVQRRFPDRRRRGPVPWGTFTLARRLLQQPYATQQQLANLTGISQPRASQALRGFVEQGLAEHTGAGWRIRDLDRLLGWWLAEYPGPGGLSTYWYSLDPALVQARAMLEQVDTVTRMTDALDQPTAVLSGDVAADFIAPWRAPNRAVVYARIGVDPAEAGFVPASEEDATLEFVVPRDPGVWPLGVPVTSQRDAPLPLADPLQIVWDVHRAPGADAEEAAVRLWRELRNRSRRGYGGGVA
ncbi:helix-turn-helix domain-containing protein [Plantactinospora endophytica]|uniref:helix-turn-helix domain-containing protein n=1 Tax=Plantactinospora endophytica TaxID=673535 RepID=UPI0019452F35|nr:helix-turn-helix domain-containing protein [Plantactinospora endophytica]